MNNKYILQPEWSPHEATWIAWPYNKSDWPGKFSPIPYVYAEIVKYISRGEIVRIFVQSKEHKLTTEKILKDCDVSLSNVKLFIKKTDRGWLRDSGPMFVAEVSEVVAIDFKFNAWAKYDDYRLDDKIPSFIADKLNLKKVIAERTGKQIVLEGGAIDTNGKETLITTEECLLDEKVQTRNPGFTKQDYFEVFKKYLGISNVIWLGKGIVGDDTHGHIDDLCRFVSEDTVVLVEEKNSS
ncbi:MAG TPA: agmatine deiminase family protein, partial [Ignavibacteriaceae bacterium]